MSYDLQVWSVNAAPLTEFLPDGLRWEIDGDALLYRQRSWQISIYPSVRVLPEDIPAEVTPVLPGIGYLTELNLSPINAPESAKKFALRAAIAIAKGSHGVVFDPQEDARVLPTGIRRYVKPAPDENASVMRFSWWFVDGPLTKNKFGGLLDALMADLPEAMPRRYGMFEPPQHVYADEGREHFLSFLIENVRGTGIVWYPSAPVLDVSLQVPLSIGASKQGFRSAKLSIDVDLGALHQPGWQPGLKRLWKNVSASVRPFYGDIRTLHGFKIHRGRLFSGRGTMTHPVKSWWWPGIPAGPAHAIVLGNSYAELWPAFSESATSISDLRFIDTDDWSVATDVYDKIGYAPLEILQRDVRSTVPREYPVAWPFEPPRCHS